MHAYTRKYPIPPIKPAVIVVASKLEKNLTNPGRKSVQISQGKNAARYNQALRILSVATIAPKPANSTILG